MGYSDHKLLVALLAAFVAESVGVTIAIGWRRPAHRTDSADEVALPMEEPRLAQPARVYAAPTASAAAMPKASNGRTKVNGDARIRDLTEKMATDLEKIVARHPGGAVTFVDCGQQPCAAMVRAPDARQLHALITDLNAVYGGHVSSDDIRESTDGYAGHGYEVEVAVGTEDPELVPPLADVSAGVTGVP